MKQPNLMPWIAGFWNSCPDASGKTEWNCTVKLTPMPSVTAHGKGESIAAAERDAYAKLLTTLLDLEDLDEPNKAERDRIVELLWARGQEATT
jgi:hypothetical protein